MLASSWLLPVYIVILLWLDVKVFVLLITDFFLTLCHRVWAKALILVRWVRLDEVVNCKFFLNPVLVFKNSGIIGLKWLGTYRELRGVEVLLYALLSA